MVSIPLEGVYIYIMEIRTLTGDLIAINKGMFVDTVAMCCVPISATLALYYKGMEIKLGDYKFYTAEHSGIKKLEVNILGIWFKFDGYITLYDKAQDVNIGDEYFRYSPSFYGVKNYAPIETVLSAGIEQNLPLNEEVKAVIFRFLKELYHYFYGRGYNLYDTKE